MKRNLLMPQLLLAPRGLITILLYFSILDDYDQYLIEGFDTGILLYTIIITSIIMAIALITDRGEKVSEVFIQSMRDIPQQLIPNRKQTIDEKLERELKMEQDKSSPREPDPSLRE